MTITPEELAVLMQEVEVADPIVFMCIDVHRGNVEVACQLLRKMQMRHAALRRRRPRLILVRFAANTIKIAASTQGGQA